jgi:hypothetical protein
LKEPKRKFPLADKLLKDEDEEEDNNKPEVKPISPVRNIDLELEITVKLTKIESESISRYSVAIESPIESHASITTSIVIFLLNF